MVITELHIQNIKGIKEFVLKHNIQANRPNIFVAPNGFGKSSIAIGFESLKQNRIDLSEENHYNNNYANEPLIKIKLSTGQTLIASKTQNDISAHFDIYVVNNQLKPKATAQRYGGRVIAKASVNIPPTTIIRTIPTKTDYQYLYTRCKNDFGNNGFVLPNITSLFSKPGLIGDLEKNINFHEFGLKRFLNEFSPIISSIKDIKEKTHAKTKEKVNNINISIHNQEYDKFCSVLTSVSEIRTPIDLLLALWQILEVKQAMGANYKKAIAYSNYLRKKDIMDSTLSELNPFSDRFKLTTKEIKLNENNKSLIIEWPNANSISSGQRDILTFISQLMECQFEESKACILIIDEFFDYLDDANLVAFQYYISRLIDSYRKKKRIIIPILLTHIDPNYLKHFCFDDKRMNVCYLKPTRGRISDKMNKLISLRETELIKDKLDTYYLHFHPESDNIDITLQFKTLGLNQDWGKANKFITKIDRETRKLLLEEDKKYDPLAVCISIRRRIEYNIFNQITSDEMKLRFLETHGTIAKLEYARSLGIIIPETYFLLGIIYNHPLHSMDANELSLALSMKLENETIKSMIYHLW